MPNSLYDLIDHILVLTEHMSSLLHGSYVGVNYNLLIEQIRYFNGYIGKHRCPNGQRCDHIAARFEYCNHKTIVLSASSAHSRIVSLAINIAYEYLTDTEIMSLLWLNGDRSLSSKN